MSSEKKTATLSIVLRTIDEATAKIKAVNERLDEATKPVRDFKKELHELSEKSGIAGVAEGFKGVGEAVKETLFKLLEVGVVIGETVHLVFELVEHFEELGKKAERLGVGVDYLAGMRYAAEKAGVPVEALDDSLATFSVNMGKLSANSGKLKKFLEATMPAVEMQLKGAKNNAEAFDILARAMARLTDPNKRAALAQVALGNQALAPMFQKGSTAIKELREKYLDLAGSQEEAVKEASETKEAMIDFHASLDGVKAAIVEGLAPALTTIVKQLQVWFKGHRGDVKEWAESLGHKLPAAFNAVVGAIGTAIGFIKMFVDEGWKLKLIAAALAAMFVGPLVASIVRLGVAFLSLPFTPVLAGIAALAVGAYMLIEHWGAVRDFFVGLWDAIPTPFKVAIVAIGLIVAPFITIPLLILSAWDDIASFFRGLWDGVVSVFRKAWELIEPIVDKIIWAANKVKDAVSFITSKADIADPDYAKKQALAAAVGSAVGSAGGASAAAPATAQAPAETKITVDFKNAPRGTRVSTDPRSSGDVDLSVGYQMIPGFP